MGRFESIVLILCLFVTLSYFRVVFIVEWGNPNEEQFYEYMKSYAPCQNLHRNVRYPALLVTAGLNDPRVGYWEGAKFVARLRQYYAESANGCSNLVLLKTDMSTGHFSASDRYRYLRETAFEYAFILRQIIPQSM
jgi:oligopeptidase B